MPKTTSKTPFYRSKPFLWTSGTIVALIIVVAVAFRVSPAPGALLIRAVFTRGGHKTLAAMQAALPDYPVTVQSNQQYRPHDRDAKFDAYIPNSVSSGSANLPVVIWTHGGAWLSGDKTDAGPYFERLADQGYVVIAPNYSLAPGHTYPTPVFELNDLYGYLVDHAAQYHLNTQKIVLAGDSAGAQLSAQMAALITNPDYAKEVGLQPKLKPTQLVGVTLYCGIYKMEGLTQPDPTLPKIVGWGNDVTVWAYSGKRDRPSGLIRQMSPYYHVTSAFPPAFISGGNADPLTNGQSKPLATQLSTLGVSTTTLFYPANHAPGLPHEYQFTFNADGEKAFTATTQFLKAKTQ